ncbi:amidohydrolase [Antarcticibacterium flavum]|uniref:Amidohydrolase n=1 Tax=Antarcticibacterium flavum TaxID=2058175 RepID=A0A5B7X7N9_9FLAO|nr:MULTISPECIES: M20 family metallopeptidase [Antarcticibacterium]MCM4161776.1 amidohydrolase [Antarcticibacterium sp. W02-3]QCY71145.1 amidohydrolase [Antarcticibacterium flavum]
MISITKRFRTALIFQFLIYGLCAFGQVATAQSSIHQSIQARTDVIFDSLVEIRRDLHEYPEVSENEEMTSKKIEDYLLSLGLEVKSNIGGYGVVGILKGTKEGKRVAWRADMDAMSTDLPDVVDFKSKIEGVRHICGHDVHTTIGLGIANVLSSLKENLEGTVYFVFQPAEEMNKGARGMVADGLFELINPDEIYGLHMSPYPVGTIATKSANVYAHFTIMEIEYKASNDQDSLIDYTKEIMRSAQTYGPNAKFWNNENLFSPEFGVTSPNTIYKDYVALMSNFAIEESKGRVILRVLVDASNKEKLNEYSALIKNKIETSRYSEELISVKFNFENGMPVMETPMNDPELTDATMKSIYDIYGKQSIIPLYGVPPLQFSDDFARFQKFIPGVYYFLGGSNPDKGIVAMPHTPNFAVDEEAIKFGVNYFSSIIVERLKK